MKQHGLRWMFSEDKSRKKTKIRAIMHFAKEWWHIWNKL